MKMVYTSYGHAQGINMWILLYTEGLQVIRRRMGTRGMSSLIQSRLSTNSGALEFVGDTI